LSLQGTPEITSEDRDALRRAVKSLDHPSLAARLTDLVGKGIEALESALFLERLKLVFFFRLRRHVARLGLVAFWARSLSAGCSWPLSSRTIPWPALSFGMADSFRIQRKRTGSVHCRQEWFVDMRIGAGAKIVLTEERP
jgi:hypothetical protein